MGTCGKENKKKEKTIHKLQDNLRRMRTKDNFQSRKDNANRSNRDNEKSTRRLNDHSADTKRERYK